MPAGSLGATVFSGTVSDAFCPLLVEGFSIVTISNFVEQNFSQLYMKRADEELGSSPGDWELVFHIWLKYKLNCY